MKYCVKRFKLGEIYIYGVYRIIFGISGYAKSFVKIKDFKDHGEAFAYKRQLETKGTKTDRKEVIYTDLEQSAWGEKQYGEYVQGSLI